MQHIFYKRWCLFITSLFLSFLSLASELPPLRIGVPHFLPPFILEGVNKSVTGFDILFMNNICQQIHRRCVFIPMNSEDILQSIANKQIDLGVGAMTITLSRYKLVNFSIPYLLSESRFLGKKNLTEHIFNLNEFKNKQIGVARGGAFTEQLDLMPDLNKNIQHFANSNDLIAALNDGSIDLALVNNATALYWQNHSFDQIRALGKPFSYGFGIGIAVNKEAVELTKVLNLAILMVQQTPDFKQLYDLYFGEF